VLVEALNAWRLRENLTREQAAERLGLSDKTIARAEHGEPVSAKTARAIAVALLEVLV
jgi:transcriptional regulator with XRE-family HTH domain